MSRGYRSYSLLPQTPTYDAFEYDCGNDRRMTPSPEPTASNHDAAKEQSKTIAPLDAPKLLADMDFEGTSLMGALDLGDGFGGDKDLVATEESKKSTDGSLDMMSEEGGAGQSVGGSAVLVNKTATMAPEEREADLVKRYAESVEERPGLERKISTLRVHVVEDSDDDGRRRRISDASTFDPRPPTPPPHGHQQDLVEEDSYGQLEFSRPTTPGSLFRDFDGVHCEPTNQTPRNSVYEEQPPNLGRRRSSQTLSTYLGTPGRARPQSSMVYYPAPVPAVLNLPPLLSQGRRKESTDLDKSSHDNRRSIAFPGPTTPGQAPPMELPKSKAHEGMDPRRASKLPPSMRASMMLDSNQPNMPPVELTSGSAVDTLESILDASAEAPPVAFTDHPMSGAPAISYRHSKMPSLGGGRPLSTLSLFNPLHQSATQLSAPGQEGDGPVPSRTPSPPPQLPFTDESILPTTLLAELETRKAKQKSRSRTAAHLNPNGIRTTLLELDAVAEVAQNQRKGKRTHLAWENNGVPSDEEDPDEDVPLGVLYAGNVGKGGGGKEGVVIGGLLAKRDAEDSEPLSKRRARLRAEKGLTGAAPPTENADEDVPLAVLMAGKAGVTPTVAVEEEDEEETLAQRKARLKSQLPKPDFGSSISLDLPGSTPSAPRTPAADGEEETLAQRRARLKAEREQKARVDQLQYSVRSHTLMNQPSRQSLLSGLAQQGPRGSYYAGPGKGLMQSTSNVDLRQSFYPTQQHGYPMQQQQGYPIQQQMYMQQQMMGQQYVNPQAMQMGYEQQGVPVGLQQLALQQGFVPLDQKQRDMVERWRESVM